MELKKKGQEMLSARMEYALKLERLRATEYTLGHVITEMELRGEMIPKWLRDELRAVRREMVKLNESK